MNNFLYDTLPWVQAGLVIIIALACLIMIVAILVSPPQTGRGSNAITGASESYYTKNKGTSNQGRVTKLIVICAIIIAVCAILYFVAIGIRPIQQQ